MEPSGTRRNLPTYQPVFSQIPGLLWTTDRDLRFTFCDGAMLVGSGFSANEAIGLTLPQWLQSDDPELPPVRAHRRALGGEAASYTSTWNERLLHVRVEPLTDASGAVTGTIALAVDVPEKERQQGTYWISEERFRLVCEHAPIGIGIGQRGLMRYVNAAWRRMFGYGDAAELVGTELLQSIAPECRADVESRIRRQDGTEGAPASYETLGLRQDGSRFVFHMDVVRIPLYGAEGSFVFGRDLSAERRAEEELRTSERQLRDAQKVGRMGSWEWDLRTDKVTWSRELFHVFGLEPGAFTPSLGSYLDMVHPEDRDRVRPLISKAREESGILGYECRILRPDGSCLVIDVRGEVLSDSENRALRMVGVAADITERKAIEKALVEARAELETRVRERTAELAKANHALLQEMKERKLAQEQLIRSEKLASMGMVVSGVAHEINNPLNVICGNLALLTEPERLRALAGTGSRESRKIRMMLRDSNRAAQRAKLIIETFRHFARDIRQAEWIDLNECLEEALSLVGRQVRGTVRTKIELGALPKVKCFRSQMVQVFVNLVKNAYEAVGKKGTVTLGTAKRKGAVVATVADTGSGIPPEIRSRLFEPFVTTKPPGKGLGLGLSISAAIVENHRGTIEVRSRRGQGTRFRIAIPIPGGGISQRPAARTGSPSAQE